MSYINSGECKCGDCPDGLCVGCARGGKLCLPDNPAHRTSSMLEQIGGVAITRAEPSQRSVNFGGGTQNGNENGWFNLAPYNPNQQFATNTSTSTNTSTTTTGPGRNGGTSTISCDSCNGGYPTSSMISGNSCPTGMIPSSLQQNPCTTTGTVICNKCQNGAPVGNQFPGTTCPPGWTTNTNPCAGTGGVVYGCTDPLASNFSLTATTDDGSCLLTGVGGCMDPLATNFSLSAMTDDGSCTYLSSSITCYKCENNQAVGHSYINATTCPTGETTDPNPCTATGPVLQDDCYDCVNQTMHRMTRGGCAVSPDIKVAPVDTSGMSRNPCGETTEILGCTDPTSETYNPLATIDDGTCTYMDSPQLMPGCMDENANNYNELAEMEDESCTYDDVEPIDEELEELDDDIKTAGIAGDNKMLMYIAIGIGVIILLKK